MSRESESELWSFCATQRGHFCAVDLGFSMLTRFSANDREDILSRVQHRYFISAELKSRAMQALDCNVSDSQWIHLNLRQVSEDIDELALPT